MSDVQACCRFCGSERGIDRFPECDPDLKLCPDCGLVFRTGEVTPDNLKEIYSEDYYLRTWPGSLGKFFEDFKPEEHHKTRFFIKQLAELERLNGGPGRLLDVGCANGVFVWLAKERGWNAEGIEISPFAAEWGRKQFNVNIHEGTLQELPLEPGYDVITFWDTLEHLPDPKAALQAAVRRLTPGGMISVLTPDTQSLINHLVHAVRRLSPGKAKDLVRKLYHRDHLCFFDRDSLAKALIDEGLYIQWMESYDEDPRDTETTGFMRVAVWAVHLLALVLARKHELLMLARRPDRG